MPFRETWCARGMRHKEPESLNGKLGDHCFDASTAVTEGTWSAALSSASAALTAAHILVAESASTFAICRPPGHHAGPDFYGGYCYLNNAAVAARFLCVTGLGCRVADPGRGLSSRERYAGDLLFV